jgi:hypothetical protein
MLKHPTHSDFHDLLLEYSTLKFELILVIFCISWKLAIGSINDIYETLTRLLSI